MDPILHQRASELFIRACDLPPESREPFLRSECGDDSGLFQLVTELLAHDTPLSKAPGPRIGTVVTLPENVRNYRIKHLIGDGGMGLVYLAEQLEPVHRIVALKVMRYGLDTHGLLDRFDKERQVLALMDHPNIARVFDAGSTDAGRPYFAMEYVPGVPITAYCDGARLSIHARLALFTDLCRAIQHAHQKAIIHRDIKPSNVLVTVIDERPVLKVIDFGIAKALESTDEGRTLYTRPGLMLGTPEYMSPEQSLGTEAPDTRSDVYALGILLCELLVGRRPFERSDTNDRTLESLRRAIIETDPRRPSEIVHDLGSGASDVAQLRGVDAASLQRLLRVDLDWIVMRAIDRDRARRYASASELAVDVERYLSSEPVTARPPTAAYRARKYVRKHRVMVAAATGISAALIVGAAATFWQAQKARQRLTEMQNVSQHLVARFHDLADQAGGMQTKKTLAELATVTLDDLSRESDLSIDERRQLADSYEALAQVQGDAYSSSIGDVLAARQSIHAAYLQRRLVYASDTTRVDYTNEMMKVSYLRASMHQGDYNVDGLAMLNRAIAMGERVLRAELHPTTMILMSTSLQLLAEYEYGLGHTSATLACLDEAMRLRRSLADTDPGNLEYRRLLADIEKTVSYVTDDDTLSLALARHALELNTGYSNARPFAWRGMMDLAYAHRNLAYALRRFGRHGAALDEMRACLAVREHMAAADTLDYRVRHFVADGWHLVGTAFADAGRPDSSLACHLRGLALYNEMEALPSQPFWLGYELSYSYEFLAEAYAAVGDTARARESYIEALARTDCNDPSNCLRKLRSIEGYSHFMDEIGDSLGSLRAHRECFDATFDALAARLADCHGSERAWGDVVAELCHLAGVFATSDPDLSGAAAEIATTYSMRELGAMHPLTARALAVKGSLQAHAGRLVESRRTYDELLAAQPECVLVCRPTAQIVTGNIRLLDDTLDDVTAKQFRFARVEAPGWSASHIPLIKRNRLWGMEPWPRVTALSRAPS